MNTFEVLVISWTLIALFVFPMSLKIAAPYGRHVTTSWGPLISNRLAWFIMEVPALLIISGFMLSNPYGHSSAVWVFFACYFAHYLNRSIIFPLRIRTNGKKMPLSVAGMAFCFNLANASFLGYYLSHLANQPDEWLSDPRFIAGLLIFLFGMAINLDADNRLIHLRGPGETGYKIPYGGLFKYVSCPNHFGEIVEWSGFALMTFSLPGLSFAIWTAANLIPRTIKHHQWYKSKFPDYPAERKAVIPFIL